MHSPITPALLLLALAPAAAGQISIVDQARYVEGSATAQDDLGSPPESNFDRVDAIGHGAFVETLTVSTSVPMSFQSATSSATAIQDSSLGSTSISAIGNAFCGGNAPDPSGVASHSSSSRSSFEVTFDLLTAADYTLVGHIISSGDGGLSLVLASASGAVIVDVPHPGTSATTPFAHAGTLAPGRYTLTALAMGSASGNGWWNFSNGAAYDLAFDFEQRQPVPPVVYCTAKTTSNGCVPAIGWTGKPLASLTGGFHITAADVINAKNGLLFFGISGRAALPFQGGTLCVQPPLKRGPVLNSGGSAPPAADCSGTFDLDYDAWAATPFSVPAFATPGTTVVAQWWGRDPGFAPPNDTLLSDAIEFTLQP